MNTVENSTEDIKKIFVKDAVLGIISKGLGVVANIFSAGVWGGIKGAYYLIALIIDLNQEWEKVEKVHLAFNIGKVIGKGIMIAKSIILGRRKAKKAKLMK